MKHHPHHPLTAVTPCVESASRRDWIARSSAFYALFAAGLLGAASSHAADLELAFDATSLDEALAAMGGVQVSASDIALTVPQLVENGAFVPISVTSLLAQTEEISIVVESNPNPLVVLFSIPTGTQAFVSTRVKMADSGKVYAIVKAGGKLYSTYQQTVVTVGGCG